MAYGWKFHVTHKPWDGDRAFDLRITHRKGFRTTKSAVTNFTLTEIPDGEPIPIIEGHTTEQVEDNVTSFLQAALDAAWEAGLRPLAYEDTRQELTAVRGTTLRI